MRSKLVLCALLVLTVSAGISTRLCGGPCAWLVRGSLGGFFYVLFWCFLGFLVLPRARPGAIALAVLASTCAIELAQLRHPPFLEAARGTAAGALLLGSVFSWADFPWYFAGCLAAWLAGRTFPWSGITRGRGSRRGGRGRTPSPSPSGRPSLSGR